MTEGKRFAILTRTDAEGWSSFWTHKVDGEDRPLYFETREAAQAEIDDIVKFMRHEPDEYMIEEV